MYELHRVSRLFLIYIIMGESQPKKIILAATCALTGCKKKPIRKIGAKERVEVNPFHPGRRNFSLITLRVEYIYFQSEHWNKKHAGCFLLHHLLLTAYQ